jgi:leucyl aminopeptidase
MLVLANAQSIEVLPMIATALDATLARRRETREGLTKEAVTLTLPEGTLVSVAVIDAQKSTFDRHTRLRQAAAPLLAESPESLAVCVLAEGDALALASEAIYVLMTNAAHLPTQKSKPDQHPLKTLHLYGARSSDGFAAVLSLAAGNILARELSTLAPNALNPKAYRKRLRTLAGVAGLGIEEFDFKKLRSLGAGAFCAVAQGSADEDAAIVHLSYAPRGAKKSLALIGKGICFDTGGHNLKPAKYMAGMHEDMNGSAVVVGLMQALAAQRVGVRVDAWLALAQNHISPNAYKQNDIVTALDGTTIEVVHTDAEGRMVLADTLSLAARKKPDLMIDFATLTGSMITALGTRMSGVFASDPALAALAVSAGQSSGERVNLFPLEADYDKALDSKVADIKQCTLEGEADHILAARFLQRFTQARPWVHVDLSSAICSGGLGAIGTDTTGFGVLWGANFVERWLAGCER